MNTAREIGLSLVKPTPTTAMKVDQESMEYVNITVQTTPIEKRKELDENPSIVDKANKSSGLIVHSWTNEMVDDQINEVIRSQTKMKKSRL